MASADTQDSSSEPESGERHPVHNVNVRLPNQAQPQPPPQITTFFLRDTPRQHHAQYRHHFRAEPSRTFARTADTAHQHHARDRQHYRTQPSQTFVRTAHTASFRRVQITTFAHRNTLAGVLRQYNANGRGVDVWRARYKVNRFVREDAAQSSSSSLSSSSSSIHEIRIDTDPGDRPRPATFRPSSGYGGGRFGWNSSDSDDDDYDDRFRGFSHKGPRPSGGRGGGGLSHGVYMTPAAGGRRPDIRREGRDNVRIVDEGRAATRPPVVMPEFSRPSGVGRDNIRIVDEHQAPGIVPTYPDRPHSRGGVERVMIRDDQPSPWIRPREERHAQQREAGQQAPGSDIERAQNSLQVREQPRRRERHQLRLRGGGHNSTGHVVYVDPPPLVLFLFRSCPCPHLVCFADQVRQTIVFLHVRQRQARDARGRAGDRPQLA